MSMVHSTMVDHGRARHSSLGTRKLISLIASCFSGRNNYSYSILFLFYLGGKDTGWRADVDVLGN